MINFLKANAGLFGTKMLEQLCLVLIAAGLALIIGLPLGIALIRWPRIKNLMLNIISALWTIPSLALLAFFIPFFGIGFKPAIVTLAIYAFLPIVRNTVTGLENVPRESILAADGLGFTSRQKLLYVELPLAMPVILAGIRIAISVTIGVATLAAFVGAGGLGDFINQGLALNNTRLLLLGAIPAALMALLFDFLLGKLEIKLIEREFFGVGRSKWLWLWLIGLLIVATGSYITYQLMVVNRGNNTIRIASKNFTEQIILGEILAQTLETKTKLHVVRKFNLGTTAICQAALMNNQIDMYPEYTGTAYLTVLNYAIPKKSQQVYGIVKRDYLQKFNLVWSPPFGFNNTQSMAVRKDFADRYQLRNISDLKPIENILIIGAPAEFLQRPDALPGLQKVYQLNFAAIKQMDPGLMYQAINNNAVNVINAFSTDGRILAYNLVLLQDDKHFYPPYDAAVIFRADILAKHKNILPALEPLFGAIDEKTMRRLNYQVDVLKRSPAEVAREFLHSLDKTAIPK